MKVNTSGKVATTAKTIGIVATKSLLTLAIIAGLKVTTGTAAGISAGHASSAEAAAAPASPAMMPMNASSQLPNYRVSAINLRHWDKKIVAVYVDPSGDSTKEPQEVMGSVTKGLSLWNAKLGSAIRLATTSNREDADITLSFVAPGTLSGGAVGRTDVTYHLDDQILTRACVRISSELPGDTLIQVTAHELGHALGIQGHSPDKHDLMYPYAHLPAEVTARDFGTMAISYKINPTTATNDPAMQTANTGHDSQSDSATEFANPQH